MRQPPLSSSGRAVSLNARLVLTTVTLVGVVALLIAVATTVAMRDYLVGQLDRQVHAALDRATSDSSTIQPPAPGTAEPGSFANQSPGTIVALLEPSGQTRAWAMELGPGIGEDDDALSAAAVRELADTASRQPQTVDIPGAGSYRVVSVPVRYQVGGLDQGSATFLIGLPTDDVDDAVRSLIWWELLFAGFGIAAAVVVGMVVVRRQLRPLREVAATAHRVASLPLASGDIAIEERVPMADQSTEVGQVAGAVNTLLDHVEGALDARHRSEQRVRQFVADASHELRTPLATIKGYSELARRHPDDADGARVALDKVEQESTRMTELVEDLLLLARLDSGRPLEQAPVDLSQLLVEATADARVVAPTHRWRLSLPPDAVIVTGDDRRLHQLITNLLSNAAKYTPAGTTVTVSARPGQPCWLSVHDDGPGFPPDLVDRAFERFTRADAGRTRAGGAGLGLSLVQAIAVAHGGQVGLTSAPGDTTVSVWLP